MLYPGQGNWFWSQMRDLTISFYTLGPKLPCHIWVVILSQSYGYSRCKIRPFFFNLFFFSCVSDHFHIESRTTPKHDYSVQPCSRISLLHTLGSAARISFDIFGSNRTQVGETVFKNEEIIFRKRIYSLVSDIILVQCVIRGTRK